jgi:hypothetical protein
MGIERENSCAMGSKHEKAAGYCQILPELDFLI